MFSNYPLKTNNFKTAKGKAKQVNVQTSSVQKVIVSEKSVFCSLKDLSHLKHTQ